VDIGACSVAGTEQLTMKGLINLCTDVLKDQYLRISPRTSIATTFVGTSPANAADHLAMMEKYYNAHPFATTEVSFSAIPAVSDSGGELVWCSDAGEECECSTTVYFGTWFNRDRFPRSSGVIGIIGITNRLHLFFQYYHYVQWI
jgi:hypothetical protein